VQKTLLATHGGYEGPSLIESLETELLEATIRYLEVKDTLPNKFSDWEKELKKVGAARGMMRGCATAVAIVRNVYTSDDSQVIKGIEREFVRLAKQEVNGKLTS
jgi:hypothetical protein